MVTKTSEIEQNRWDILKYVVQIALDVELKETEKSWDQLKKTKYIR